MRYACCRTSSASACSLHDPPRNAEEALVVAGASGGSNAPVSPARIRRTRSSSEGGRRGTPWKGRVRGHRRTSCHQTRLSPLYSIKGEDEWLSSSRYGIRKGRRGWRASWGLRWRAPRTAGGARTRAPGAAGGTSSASTPSGTRSFWTDTLRLHETISTSVDPTTALSVGLKVDADALPAGDPEDRRPEEPGDHDRAAEAERGGGGQGDGGTRRTERTSSPGWASPCALCHSTVDDSVMPGIGHRLDGWPNTTLNPGAIIALSPALDAAKKAVYNSWGAGQVRPALQPGRQERAGGHPAGLRAGRRAAGHVHRRRRHQLLEQLRRGDADGGPRRLREPSLGHRREAEGRGPGGAEAARL